MLPTLLQNHNSIIHINIIVEKSNILTYKKTYMSELFATLSKQCPAVRTHCRSIKTPPQRNGSSCFGILNLIRAINGRELGSTHPPFTISGIFEQNPLIFSNSKHSEIYKSEEYFKFFSWCSHMK